MSLILWCFCILTTLLLSQAFINVHENSKKIFQKPPNLKDDSLFGFSVAYETNSKRLLVSAPKASHIGQIFIINMDNGTMNNDDEDYFKDKFRGRSKKYDYWLGATVAAGPDFFVTCTPRSIEEVYTSLRSVDRKMPATLSLCFIQVKTMDMLRTIKDKERFYNTTNFRDRMDSFGWDIHVVANEKDVLIGGAAINKGRVLIYKNVKDKKTIPELIYRINEDNPYKYNFGYSITSGKFFSDQTVYAISTTFGDSGFGKVYFFDLNLNQVAIINSGEIGSMFGAALCSAMLRGPALLVGAPTYAEDENSYNVGAVYIYAAPSTGTTRMEKRATVKGVASGGFFGHSIISLGDMDDDGNDEIAIAAPYEYDGKGAVYIYSGVGILEGETLSKDEENKVWRKILPGPLRSFGYSLAVLRSDSESNDLAIGAIDSNVVVVYKGIASITVDLSGSINSIGKNIIGTKDLMAIESCVNVKYPVKPHKVEADLEIMIKITDQSCTFNEGGKDRVYVYDEKVKDKTNRLCRNNIKVSCPAKRTSNVIISYEITATLKGDPERDEYDPSRVLLSQRSRLSFASSELAPCDGKICEPKLTVNISSTIAKPYIVGSSDSEEVSLTVLNTGDPAYGACAEVHVQGAEVYRFPSDCTKPTGGDTVLCKYKFSISKGEEWRIGTLSLKPRQDITSVEDHYVEIKCVLYDDCNARKNNKTFTEKYHLKGDTENIMITAQTNPEGDVDVTQYILAEGKSFEHLYEIENKGVTNWNGLQIEIIVEKAPYIGLSQVPIKIYPPSAHLIECPVGDRTLAGDTVKATCDIGDLMKLEKTLVTISMEILPNTLELDKAKPNVTVSSTLTVLNIDKSLSTETLVKLQEASVPTWIIATACVIGLLLIGPITFALFEIGFLKRKKREKLLELKKDVYRQSIRRSMMRESMMATAKRKSTEDLQFLMSVAEGDQEPDMTIDEKLQCHKI